MKFSFMKSRSFIVLSVVISIFVIGLGISFWLYAKQFTDTAGGSARIRLPRQYHGQEINNKKDAHTERLIFLKREHPTTTVTVDKETGAIISANVIHANFLDTLEKNAKKLFAVTYPGYKEQAVQRIKIDDRDAVDFRYEYMGGKHQIYAHYIIVPVDNDAYYVVIQSEESAELEAVYKRILRTFDITS